jgi:hypothetical protein
MAEKLHAESSVISPGMLLQVLLNDHGEEDRLTVLRIGVLTVLIAHQHDYVGLLDLATLQILLNEGVTLYVYYIGFILREPNHLLQEWVRHIGYE